MMDIALPVDQIIQQGPLVAFMLWVIWNQKQTNAGLRDAIESVQDKRFGVLNEMISKLEEKAEECQRDRTMLIRQNHEFALKIQDFELRFDKLRVAYDSEQKR